MNPDTRHVQLAPHAIALTSCHVTKADLLQTGKVPTQIEQQKSMCFFTESLKLEERNRLAKCLLSRVEIITTRPAGPIGL